MNVAPSLYSVHNTVSSDDDGSVGFLLFVEMISVSGVKYSEYVVLISCGVALTLVRL